MDGESKCVVSTTPLLNEQAPLFFVLVVRVIRPGLERRFVDVAGKVNGRSIVNTIDAIIEDATGWQRSVHGGFAFHLFALVFIKSCPSD
jgi:hypothetical protein